MPMYIDADSYIKYCEENWIPLNVDAVLAQKKITDVRESVRAHWKPVHLTAFGVCSACGAKWQFTDLMSFCPNCGSKMEAMEEEDE